MGQRVINTSVKEQMVHFLYKRADPGSGTTELLPCRFYTERLLCTFPYPHLTRRNPANQKATVSIFEKGTGSSETPEL